MAKDISVEQHLKEWSALVEKLKLMESSRTIDYRISRVEHLIQEYKEE